MASTRPLSRPRGAILLAAGLWLLLLATNPGRNETIDVATRLAVTRQLWTAGEVTVEHRPPGTESLWIEVGPNRYAAPYGIGQSLLFVPFDMVSALLETVAPETWRGQLPWLPIGLGLLPWLGLGYWIALRSLLREWGFAEPWPTLGSLALMLGSIAFFYAGQGQEETLVGLCLALTIRFALRLRREPSLANAAATGLFGGACLLIRPVAALALLVVPPLLFSLPTTRTARLRILSAAALALAAVGLVALWYNDARFGSIFSIGYDRMGHFSKVAIDGRWVPTLASLLVGAGGGLLVVSPLFALAGAGVPRLWRIDRAYCVGMLLALLSCYAFFSAWHDSHTGGSAWGTRYEVHLLPLFAIPLTLGLQRLSENRAWRTVAIAIVVLSVAIQGLSVFATYHLEPVQAECDGGGEAQLLEDPLQGQLGRRVQNVVRWAAGAGPPPTQDATCRPLLEKMWERYLPNFWGPVYAHRLARGGNWVLLCWATVLASSMVAIVLGLRRQLKS